MKERRKPGRLSDDDYNAPAGSPSVPLGENSPDQRPMRMRKEHAEELGLKRNRKGYVNLADKQSSKIEY